MSAPDDPSRGSNPLRGDPSRHPGEPSLLRLLDGELPRDMAEEVRRHCAACRACGRSLEELTAVADALGAGPPPDPLRPIWPVVQDRLAAAERPRVQPAFALATAACVVLGLGLGLLLPDRAPTSSEPESAYLWSALGSNLADGTSGSVAGAWEGMALESEEEAR